MMKEIDRILKPGGRFVTLSLHGPKAISNYYLNQTNWSVHIYRVQSPRWDETETNRKKAFTQTLV
jgi:ubiquinone/menaquinone biosynthesis C-methylase UbiE